MNVKLISSALIAMAMSASAHAATLTATFDPTPTRGSSTSAPADIIALTLSDLAGGGVQVTATGLSSDFGVGSFFLAGVDASDFTGATGTFNASRSNAYVQDLGVRGAGFTSGALDIFDGSSLNFSSTSTNVTTADFSGLTVGFISVSAGATNRLQALFGGSLSEVAPVPLPAGLPLMLVSIGALGLVRRKVKSTAA